MKFESASLSKGVVKLFLLLTIISHQGCTGYYDYVSDEPVIYGKYIDVSDLFIATTGKVFTKEQNYRNNIVTKKDVLTVWGKPYDIYVSDSSFVKTNYTGQEYWVYEKNVSFGGISPHVMLIPVSLIMWPSGYYKTRITFNNENVVAVNKEEGSFEDGWLCVLPFLRCDDNWELH